ncbi:hypothetical protein [Gilliamella sp. BG7]|uniref:hypothetical protein n=1 Tax=unclassified Gilliamella TaxID=2685620 RepID=UPI00398859EB
MCHHDNGAEFVAPYYVDINPDLFEEDKNHAKFKIKIDNKEYNSDVYFNAIYKVMNEK